MFKDINGNEFGKNELRDRAEVDFRESLITPDRIYVDLQLMKDYTLGALLLVISQEPDGLRRDTLYETLRSTLVDYDHRIVDDVGQFFPEFGLSTKEIEAIIADPRYANFIILGSPSTQYHQAMKENWKLNINHSLVAEKFTVKPSPTGKGFHRNWESVTYVINTWPVAVPTGYALQLLQEYFAAEFQSDVVVISENPADLRGEFYDTIDEFNFYQIGRHNSNPNFGIRSANINYTRKSVCSSMIFERAKFDVAIFDRKKLETSLNFIEAQCGIMYKNFSWINTAFLSTDPTVHAEPTSDKDKS